MDELLKGLKELDDNEQELKEATSEALGTRGPKGETPVKGKDYFTDEEISSFKEEVTPIKGKDYFDGEPGYTPVKGVDYFDGKEGKNPITVSKTPPLNPKKGDLWYKD